MFVFAVFASILVVSSHAATIAPMATCHNSFQCGQNTCCRGTSGAVISDTEMGGFGGPFLHMGNRMENGTCSTRPAQKGELCDSHCKCDVGLACYRPVSGVCCPPHTCYDEAYVQKQQAYWSKCMTDPSCALPP